ncbi:hypothetical protein CC80DRAFT_457924 [Byssothecium circinans]|uniref:Glycosyltransferase 61 catalytic domain-containing protein n=1 Tax=Byssothecium circinans TaxID=147558 RepID=A0A6A5TEM4_9PLEO|nr:hypothetical protein CC80DRAFT_457924 [Byssothecium circinans]
MRAPLALDLRVRYLGLFIGIAVFCVSLSWLYGEEVTPAIPLGFHRAHGNSELVRVDTDRWRQHLTQHESATSQDSKPPSLSTSQPALPSIYYYERPEPESCRNTFGLGYLYNFRDSATQYCTDDATSPMTCFNTLAHTSEKEKHIHDNFCIARNAKVKAATKKVELGCTLREFNEEEKARGVLKPDDFHDYGWFDTGPFITFDRSIELQKAIPHWEYAPPPTKRDGKPKAKFTILMNRDANSFGHNFAEISSLILTLDIAKMTVDPKTAQPFFKDGDEEHTQLMILDGKEDGHFLELYSLAAKLPVRRIEQVEEDEDLGTIILPLAGISNPMWLWRWTYHGCHGQWEWLRAFRNRVLDHYGLLDHAPRGPQHPKDEFQPIILKNWNEKLVVTVIDRYKQSRELVNQDTCIAALQAAYPDIVINIARFKQHTFAEQFNMTHNTDVLVGVHGAGMVHTVFLRPKSAVVELQPQGVQWQGHRNEASGLDLHYFTTHTKPVVEEGKEQNWQVDKMEMDPEQFVRVVGTAIRSVYSHRSDNRDID